MPVTTPEISDVRHGQAWRPLQRVKNDLIFAFVSVTLAALVLFPKRWMVSAGRNLARLAYVLLRRERNLALANLAQARIGENEAARRHIAREAFLELGTSVGEIAAVLDGGAFEPVPFSEGAQRVLREALAEGRGVLFVSAHLGAWERVFSTIRAAGFPMLTVARESYDPRLTRLYERVRGRGASLYRGDPQVALRVMRHLRRGDIVGMPMDLATRVPSVVVPFLGVPARVALGPARLAIASRAVVVVGTLAPGGGSDRELTVERVETADFLGQVDPSELTGRLAIALSSRILALPSAWLWMHDRFSKGAARSW